jgi:pimeloyl-ACP methyl ester carboxylesterase
MPTDPKSNLYYESSGPDTAKTIVFLHGGGIAGWMLREKVKAFQPRYHCLVPDMPGQGKNTTNGTGPYTTEGAADRIADLIRSQAHGGKAHVVGLSEGAQMVVALLSRYPDVLLLVGYG